MTQEAQHLAVGRRAGQCHVAVPECSIDLEMEAWFGCGVAGAPRLLQDVPVRREVKVQVVSLDLRGGDLRTNEQNEMK